MEKAAANPRAQKVLVIFADRAPLLIVVGRYVPGLRIVVNFTMGGVLRMPYPRFLRWSVLSGVLWGFYTGLLAYLIASLFDGQTLLPLIISGCVTSAAITWVMVVLHRDLVRSRDADVDAPEASGAAPA
jgi:membrane-associated protein